MPSLLTMAAPPLVGAFIGYMTNYVAIRMLFRPLRPWRVLGWRLPLTPGVIPSKREQLAENIGEMVGEHLLTSNDVQRALTEKGFQDELRHLICSRLQSLFRKDLGPLGSLIPERFQSHFRAGVNILRWRFLKLLHTHLASEPVRDQLATAITGHLHHFFDQPLNEKLSPADRDRLVAFMEKSAADVLASPEVTEWIHSRVNEWVRGLREEPRSLRELLPDDLTGFLISRAEKATPGLLEKLAVLLQEPATQKKIATALGTAAVKFAASLGPMAALLGGFLNPETLASKIMGYLQDNGEEIARILLNDTVQERLTGLLREQAEQFLDKPVESLLGKVDPATMEEIAAGLAGQIKAMLTRPDTAAALAGLFRDELEKRADSPIHEVLAQLFGEQRLADAAQWAARETVAVIGGGGVKRMLDGLISALLEDRLLTRPIGPLADFLPKAVVAGIEDFLLQQTGELLVREVPDLVDSLNIKQMVADKVNSLDLLHLEGLLLSIMEEQFKYINLFGALLGFVIGGLNLLFLLPNG